MSDPIRHQWLVVTAVASVLAAWMGLGSLHDSQHADSLLTVLISTQRWTPFFWGQDRFGMLVPLLAMPIRHPLANLLFQGWVMTLAALLAPFAMARFLTGRAGAWMAIGACTNLLLLSLATPAVQFDWLVTQPYGLSIALGFSALNVADGHGGPGRIAAALALLLLACWVNIGVVFTLAVAAVVRGSRPVRLVVLETAAAAAASLAAASLASAHTVTALAPPLQWLSGWRQLLEGTSGVTDHPGVVIAIAVGAMVAAFWLWTNRGLPEPRTSIAVVLMAIGSWLVVGTSLWVGMNRYSFRYMYPSLMIAGVGVATVCAALFARRAKAFSAASMVALVALASVRSGLPSLERLERGVDDRFGRETAAVLRSGATVIAGDYWRVWPAVFHANLELARRRTHARVFGLAYRSEATDDLWKKAGRQVVAAASDDQSVAAIAGEHGVTVTLVTRLPEIDLYTAQP